MSYIDVIKDKARMDKKTIVLPETTDKRTLIAASNIVQEGIADIIMIGNEEKIMDGATWLEIELDGVTIINPHTSEKLDSYVELLYETRKNKGMTPEKARELKDALYRRYAMGEIELEDFREFKRIFEQDCQKAEQAMDAQRTSCMSTFTR